MSALLPADTAWLVPRLAQANHYQDGDGDGGSISCHVDTPSSRPASDSSCENEMVCMGRVYTPRVSIATGLAVLLFVLALIALSIGQRRVVAGPSVALLRSLFPSWRFFETPEEQVLLLARCVGEGESGPFLPAVPAAPRGLSTLLFSARGNLLLACHDLVDSLVCELSELGSVELSRAEQLTSYRLVQNMVCWQLRQQSPGLSAYQLKLVSRAADGSEEELFVSPVYPC